MDSWLYWGGIVLILIISIFMFRPLALLLACLLIAWVGLKIRRESSKTSIKVRRESSKPSIKVRRESSKPSIERILKEFLKPSIETMEFPIQQVNPSAPDRTIPTNVKLYVWRRDGGRCVQCGSNEKLEYDHIIPVSKGGSNTERNVQLLCEHCNRMKHANIM